MPTLSLTVTASQAEIIDHPAKVKVVTCGRRWGKTFSALSYLVKTALGNPRLESSYVGKTHKLAYKLFLALTSHKALKPYILNHKQQPSMHILWRNGHTTWFFSGDKPDNLRGDGLVLCIVDEAAHLSERLICEVLEPALLDCDGTFVLLSTPRGRNFYWERFENGQKYPNEQDCKSWRHPTSSAIWAQGEAGKRALARYKATVSNSVWRQECECEVDENGAATFKHHLIARATRGEARGPQQGFGYIVAYDSGKKKNPPGFVVLECSDADLKATVVHSEEMDLGTDYPVQVDRVITLARQYKACVMVDSTGAGTKDAIVDFIKKAAPEIAVHPIQLRGGIHANLVKLGEWHLENDLLSIPPQFTTLLLQLRQMEYDKTERGGYFYHAPEGEFDDCVWALLMALDGKKRRLYRVWTSAAPRPAPGSQGDVFWRQRNQREEVGGKL